MNIQPTSEPSTPTNTYAEENNDHQAEFTNLSGSGHKEIAESSSRNIGNSNVHTSSNPQFLNTIVEPKNITEAMADSAWIEAMQDELHQFDRLQVWELVDKPFGKNEGGYWISMNHLASVLAWGLEDICRLCCTQVFFQFTDGSENAVLNGLIEGGGYCAQPADSLIMIIRTSLRLRKLYMELKQAP
ncbi:hypothetical protein Tco_0374420 [Tanacetum coccineum]